MTAPVNQPEVYGKYVLLERLAAGGMGEVFLARAGAKGFEKFFALKRILAQHAESPEFAQMLMNEARISVALVHPNIAQVFEFGQLHSSFFMVLEYVEGLSLNAVIRRGHDRDTKMRQADAVWVALQVCRALHYAHNKRDNDGNDLKIVHRDISPHNILIDETGSVKLIDFGIAKAAQGQIQTEASTIKGKIPYMSPEQASGATTIDRRSDLYALGIVLYECLTFERMYPSGNTFETFALVRLGKIPDLDAQLGGKIPANLLALLKRALQLKPEDRFQTAAEMETELSRILHELDPAHTSYALADLVLKLDAEREVRKDRLKSYAKVVPEELVSTRNWTPREVSKSNPKLLAPPLPVDVTLGSMAATGVMGPGKKTVETIDAVEEMLDASASGELQVPKRFSMPATVAAIAVTIAAIAGAVYGFHTPTETPGGAALSTTAANPSTAPTTAPVASTTAPVATTTAPVASTTAPVASTTGPVAPTTAPTATTATAPAVPVAKPAPVASKKGASPRVKHEETKESECVAVNAVPWAYVKERDKRLGQTPMPCLELSVGKHSLVLENPALGKSKTVDVVVKAGEPGHVVVHFD